MHQMQLANNDNNTKQLINTQSIVMRGPFYSFAQVLGNFEWKYFQHLEYCFQFLKPAF